MAAIYQPIRIAVLVLTGISLVLTILDLVDLFQYGQRDSRAIITHAIIGVVLFIGAWGSYQNLRTYLLTFSLIVIIAIIVDFTGASIGRKLGPYASIVTVILALSQSELIRRGYA